MAMLAEPRRRSKYSVDPRGLNWSKDEDKFGQKMLEKMGWQNGKGLGAKEDGMRDHVAVKHKSDHKGVGCSKSHADNWIAQQDDFNSLLSSLNESSDTVNQSEGSDAVLSLEMKSKTSKARVHYMKFTKGKDLSSKNNQDLDCVFGRRKSKSAPATPQTQSETESPENSDSEKNNEEDSKSMVDKSHGFTTVKNNLSVTDYFAQKMLEVKARLKVKASGMGTHGSEAVDELEQRSKITEGQQEETMKNVQSADVEKLGQVSKVRESLGMIKSNTAPGSLQSMVVEKDAGEADDQPGTSTGSPVSGAEVEEVRWKSKKSKRMRNLEDIEEDNIEAVTHGVRVCGNNDDQEEIDRPEKRRMQTAFKAKEKPKKKRKKGAKVTVVNSGLLELEDSEGIQEQDLAEEDAEGAGGEGGLNRNEAKKEKLKKKRQKRKRQRVEDLGEREGYVKIESCVNKKKLREEQQTRRDGEEMRREMGFVGSNLGEVVGYGAVGGGSIVSLLLGGSSNSSNANRSLQELTEVTTKKKKNKKNKKMIS